MITKEAIFLSSYNTEFESQKTHQKIECYRVNIAVDIEDKGFVTCAFYVSRKSKGLYADLVPGEHAMFDFDIDWFSQKIKLMGVSAS